MTLSRAQRLRRNVEYRTGIWWGSYRLPAAFMGDDRMPQPPFYIVLHGKGDGFVRLEWGFRRRGFYLHWGERARASR